MSDISVEIGMLMCCESEKLVLRTESANDVLPAMASTVTHVTRPKWAEIPKFSPDFGRFGGYLRFLPLVAGWPLATPIHHKMHQKLPVRALPSRKFYLVTVTGRLISFTASIDLSTDRNGTVSYLRHTFAHSLAANPRRYEG